MALTARSRTPETLSRVVGVVKQRWKPWTARWTKCAWPVDYIRKRPVLIHRYGIPLLAAKRIASSPGGATARCPLFGTYLSSRKSPMYIVLSPVTAKPLT